MTLLHSLGWISHRIFYWILTGFLIGFSLDFLLDSIGFPTCSSLGFLLDPYSISYMIFTGFPTGSWFDFLLDTNWISYWILTGFTTRS